MRCLFTFQKVNFVFLSQNTTYQPVYQQNHHIKKESDQQDIGQESQDTTNKLSNLYTPRPEDADILKDFTVSKSDPKYQTLPYNTKFTVNLLPSRTNTRVNENNNNVNNTETSKEGEVNHHISSWAHVNGNVQSQHMTVHSAPLSAINKNIATPLSQNDALSRKLSNEQNGNGVENRGNAYQNNTKHHGNEHSHYPVSSGTTANGAIFHQVCWDGFWFYGYCVQ